MASAGQQLAYRILLADDDSAIREMMARLLEHKGFEVVAAASVTEALNRIVTQSFDALITDLHMPGPGDGFTIISAMRHSQPGALTMLVSGYPDVKGAMAAILLEADEIVVKPFEIGPFADLVYERVSNRKPAQHRVKESVGRILQRCSINLIADWLARAKQSEELNHISLRDDERTGHLPKLVEDLVRRLSQASHTTRDSDAQFSNAAVAHGELRYWQGYTPAMLVHESRILQVTLFGTLDSNLNSLDFSALLPDVMTIADEVDAQLTQSMKSFTRLMSEEAA